MSHLDLDALAAVFQNCTGDSVEFSQGALPGQKSLFGASAAPRAPSPGRPKTPVAPRPSLLESIADEEAKKPKPLPGQGEFAFHEQAEEFSPVHHAVAQRFNIPPAAVKSVLETHPDELARRARYVAPSSQMHDVVGPTLDYEDHPLGTARIGWPRHSTGNTNEAYVDFLREFDPSKLNSSEHEQSADYERAHMKKSGSVTAYVNWLKDGHKPPPISVYDVDGKPGVMQSSNRRRLLAAQMSGAKSITGWHGTSNPETGNPLNYGDIMRAAKDHETQSFSRDDEFGPVEFGRSHTLPTQPFRRLIDKKRTHHDVLKEEEKAGKKKKAPTDNGESGWTKVGGSSVHVDDDGVIDKGCPGLLGEEVEDLIDESDESRERREARQHHAYAAGVRGHELTPAQAKALGSDEHVAAYRRDMAAAKTHPVPTVSAIDVARGFDDQTGLPITSRPVTAAHSVPRDGGNGHELRIEDDARTAETEERLAQQPAETFQPAPELDPRAKPYQFWKQNPLSQILGNDLPRPSWLGDRPQPDHAAGEKLEPQLEQMEAEIARIRELRDAFLSKRVDIAALKANGYSSAEIAQAGVKEALNNKLEPLVEARNTVKAQLDDYLRQTRPDYQRQQDIARHKEVERRLWERGAEEDSAVRRAAKVYGADIDEVIASIPRAMVAYAEANFPLEAAKAEARRLTGLNAHTIRSVEDEIPDGDIKADSLLRTHPELGWQYGDTDNQRKMVELIREGSAQMPSRTSSEIADLAASMVVGGRPRDFSTEGIHFRDDSEDESLSDSDEWSPAGDTAETSFDPSSWSRSDSVESIAAALGVSVSAIQAVIQDMPGSRADGLASLARLARDPSRRGVVRSREGHVIGYVTRNGNQLTFRDGNSRFLGTATHGHDRATFRDRRGHVGGSVGQFSRSLDEIGPVEFSADPPSQVHHTQTPAFKKWHEGSHVVHEDGKPKVVYHGTRSPIEAFDKSKTSPGWHSVGGSFFFSETPSLANEYAGTTNAEEGGNVIPAYLSLKNPYRAESLGPLIRQFGAHGHADARAHLEKQGHDGMILGSGENKTIAAFHPHQIKSAIGNSGAFDPQDNRITFSRDFGPVEFSVSDHGALVEPDGSPSVVYHGTNASFSGFDASRAGARSGNLGHLGFGHYFYAKGGNPKQWGNRVIAAKVRLQTPLNIHETSSLHPEWKKREAAENSHVDNAIGDPEFSAALKQKGNLRLAILHYGPQKFTDALTKHGHDGVISHSVSPEGVARRNEIVAFHPKQIDTVSENSTNFSRDFGPVEFSADPPSQVHHTQTPAFKKWHEGSHVVHEDGTPKVVYHGTNALFDEFSDDALGGTTSASTTALGHYFTNKPEVAGEFGQGHGQHIKPVYLSVKKPLIIEPHAGDYRHENLNGQRVRVYNDGDTRGDLEKDPFHAMKRDWILPVVQQHFGSTATHPRHLTRDDFANFRQHMAKKGFDGITIKQTQMDAPLAPRSGEHDFHIAFHPHQIKSAIGNSGAFDPQDNRITFSRDFGPVEFGRSPLPGQQELPFDAVKSKRPQIETAHDGTRQVDIPETRTNAPFRATLKTGKTDGLTHFVTLDHAGKDWSKFRAPTQHVERFLDELHGHLGHPANSGHKTLDHVLSGGGKYIGKGNDNAVYDAGNGTVVKAAVITPYHEGNGLRSPDAANAIIDNSVKATKHLRSKGVLGILPQYGVNHDGRSFAVMPKVDTTSPLTEKHIQQLQDTLSGMHSAGYRLGDQVQAGLDHNGNAAIYDVGSVSALDPERDGAYGHNREDDDFSELSRLAEKHGIKYTRPKQLDKASKYRQMLHDVLDSKGMTPEEAWQSQHKLHSSARGLSIKPKGFGGATETQDPEGHDEWGMHDAAREQLEKWSGKPTYQVSQRPPSTVQMSRDSEVPHPFEQRYSDAVASGDNHAAQKHVDHATNVALKSHRDKWGEAGVESFASAKNGDITLHSVKVPKEHRGQGRGTAYMNDLHGFADKHGMRVLLTPDDSFGASSVGRLKRFYGGLGYHANAGRNKDFRTREAMIRHPANYEGKSAYAFDRDESGGVVPLQQKFGITIPHDAETNQFSRKPATGQGAFDWDEEAHPRDDAGRFADKLHHQIKNYLMNGGQFGLPDIHHHTGHTDHDALDPLANPTTRALKSLVDADAISRTGPEHHNVRFYLTDEQREQHEASGFASEKRDAKSDGKPEEKPQAGPAGLTKREAIAKASANKSGDKGLSHDEMVHATYLYTGTAPQGWSAVAVKGMKEVEGDKGEGVTVPEFEMPSGYKPVPVVWDGGPQSACCGLCGHDIKNIYYIQNDAEKWTMGVGSECVTKFGEGDSGERLAKKAVWAANRDFLSNVWETFDTLGHRFGDTDKHGQHHTHLGSSAPFWKIMAESGVKNHNEITAAQRKAFESAAAKINTVYGQLKKLLYNSSGAPVTHAGKKIVSRNYIDATRGYKDSTAHYDASKDAAITAWTKRNAEEARKLIGEVDEILRSLPESKKAEKPQSFSREDDFGPVELFGDSEEFGPVEFARKPAKGQVAFDFESPVESHLDDAPGENVATKQDQLFDVQESDVPPEHHEEAKALSAKHGGGEVRRLKNGDWQLRAPIGGKVSEVNGVFYIGGRFMPIHGIDSQAAKKLKPKREKSKGDLFTPPKPNENGRQREKRVEMTPDEIAAEKERREEQRQWNEIASGPLGRLLDLKAEPRYEGATPILDEWLRLAEKIGKEGIAKLKDRLEPEVHSSMEAAWKPIIERDAAITDEEWKKSHYGSRRSADDIEWEKNELHNRADRWASGKPRIYKAHEKLVPGSHYVQELLSELMNDTHKQDKGGFIPRLKKYSDMLAALVPAPLISPAEARQHGYFGNKFDGRTAEGKKVKAGDGWVKKNADGKYETFTDEQVRDAIKPAEFSRSLDSIGPVEFAADSEEFSRDLADFAPVEFGLMDWFRKKPTPPTPQTPPSSAPAGDEPEQVHESKWSPEVPVESSNVHSYSWEKQGNEGQGNMIVRYKNKEGGSGPVYRYIGTPKSVYEGMEAAPSKGGFVWDRLRVRGSKVAHQYPFSLAGTGATDYIPRAASLRRGFKGEHYIERSFQGRKSELAPGTTTGRPAERLDGYDPGKLTFKPSPPSPSLPKPATPQPPAPSKTSSLISKVASFFRKPKTPREFSRDEIEAFELMLADAAARD